MIVVFALRDSLLPEGCVLTLILRLIDLQGNKANLRVALLQCCKLLIDLSLLIRRGSMFAPCWRNDLNRFDLRTHHAMVVAFDNHTVFLEDAGPICA